MLRSDTIFPLMFKYAGYALKSSLPNSPEYLVHPLRKFLLNSISSGF